MSQVRKETEMEDRLEDSADEGTLKLGTTTMELPPEMLTYLLEMHCKNLELGELKKLRLVSKAWRDALETMWRKRVTVCLFPSSVKQFMKMVKEPSFNLENCPLPNFQITLAVFTKNQSEYLAGMNEFWNIFGTSIKHLELRRPKIGNGHKLLETILLKLVNMEKFCLFAPEYVSEVTTQDAGTLATIKKGKLSYLKLDLREGFTNSSDVKEFPFPLTWYQFLASFPNLQQLEILGEGVDKVLNISNDSLHYRQCLQAVKKLSLEGGLQHLQHVQIWGDETGHQDGSSCRKCVEDICQSNLPSLDSLHIEFRLPRITQEHLASRMVLKKFCSNLKRLCLRLPVFFSQLFPFGQRLEKLEHLSVSWDIAHFIRNAKYLPNLKSFSVFSISDDVRRPSSTIIWQDNTSKMMNIRRSRENEFKAELPPQIHNYDGSSEDDEVDDEDEDFRMLNVRTKGRGFLFEGYKSLLGNFLFVNVTSLHLECWFSCQVFKKLPKWMPNVTTLEALMTACIFPVVCDKWRKLEKLTLLQFLGDHYKGRMSIVEDFVPVDDCAIVGKKHLTVANYHCSFDHSPAQAAASQSPETKEENDSIIPNLSFLTHLKYFKMQIGQTTGRIIGKDFHLSDASALHGFYKLPQLEHLEIVADLKPETIQELFKRVPRCIVYQLWDSKAEKSDNDDNESVARKYFGMRNFN